MHSLDGSNENSLEELAWDQFIRTKVGHHDMDDLDDLNLDDIMMGDAPAVKDDALIHPDVAPAEADDDDNDDEVDDEIAALKGKLHNIAIINEMGR